MRTNEAQNDATTDGCHNLRNTDGAVEETKVCAHVTITLQSIGYEGERHCQHSSPTSTNHQEWDKLQILVVQEWNQGKANTCNKQADAISQLYILKHSEHYYPKHTTYSLYSKEYAHPVACSLEFCRLRVCGIPYSLCNSACRIVPKIKEACPAEELHHANLPECRRSIL